MPVNWSRVPQKKTSWFFMQEKGLFSHPSRIFSTLHLTFVVRWWHLGFWKGLKTDLSQTSVSYTGKISPNFDLKNMISIQRIFHEKMVQICQILNLKTFQIARVLWQFPEGSQEYRRILFFSSFLSIMQPNLAKLLSRWSPLWLHHKILKRNAAFWGS
jgi:hypothetical protein